MLIGRGINQLELVPGKVVSIFQTDDLHSSPGTYFGTVDISDDGAWIIVGDAYYDDSLPANPNWGHVYFLKRSVLWTQKDSEYQVAPSTGYDDAYFGRMVAMSGDGLVAMALSNKDSSGSSQAVINVYTRSGDVWSFDEEITGPTSPPAGSDWGQAAIHLDDDGDVMVLNDNNGATVSKGARIYADVAGTWTLKFTLNKNVSQVAISKDGLIVAFVNKSDSTIDVYEDVSGTWTLRHAISFDPSSSGEGIGQHVSLSDDGSYLAVGHPNYLVPNDGKIEVRLRSGNSWNVDYTITSPTGLLGSDVCINDAGDWLVTNAANTIVAYSRSGSTWTQQQQSITTNVVNCLEIKGNGDYAFYDDGFGNIKVFVTHLT